MGTVLLAQDLRHGRQVAVKVLNPGLGLGPERFLREIEIAASLTHPHILPVHDSGTADGLLFYVMPFVEGESLRERLARETQLPLDQALAIVRDVGDALAFAHARGVVHRDIKPGNILFEAGHAVVGDFGLARAIVAGEARLTDPGLAVGTPTYMSPEQASGEREIDGRSDVFALACVLYELLAGEAPFDGPTAQAALMRRFMGPPRGLRPYVQVSEALEASLLKALSRDPKDRHPTAAAFADDLAGRAPAPAAPEPAPEPTASKSGGRGCLGSLVIGLSALAAGLGLASAVGVAMSVPPASVRICPRTHPAGPWQQWAACIGATHRIALTSWSPAGTTWPNSRTS